MEEVEVKYKLAPLDNDQATVARAYRVLKEKFGDRSFTRDEAETCLRVWTCDYWTQRYLKTLMGNDIMVKDDDIKVKLKVKE